MVTLFCWNGVVWKKLLEFVVEGWMTLAGIEPVEGSILHMYIGVDNKVLVAMLEDTMERQFLVIHFMLSGNPVQATLLSFLPLSAGG